jgi:hypothetical protein
MALAISQQWFYVYGDGISLTGIDGFIDMLKWLYGNGNKLD